MRVCIVGAGATGLSAAYRLVSLGFDVTVVEKEDRPGGLAGAVTVGTSCLEQFYHHIFTNDAEIIGLIEELGLSGQMKWSSPKNGIYAEGRLHPFTSPLDLLRFKALPFLSRISTGMLVLKARSVGNWMDFERFNARDWLIKNCGTAAYEKLWGPLLQSKFGRDADRVSAVWIWNKFKLRGSSRGKNISSEMLGYLEGSYALLYDKMVERIEASGGKVCLSEEVLHIASTGSGGFEVQTSRQTGHYDIVLAATAPAILAQITPELPGDYKKQISDIRFKADICVMLELKERLSDYYWITVADKDSPFVLVIEHTNLFPDAGYGSSIVYLSRYLDESDELYTASDDTVAEQFTEALSGLFPSWNRASVSAAHVFRARYAQPVITLGYSAIKPGYATPVENLYTAGMAHIYPEDRGQNYAIRSGLEAAGLIGSKAGKQTVR